MKIRDADSQTVKNKAVCIATGVSRDGSREVLGLWIAESGRGHKTVRGTVLPDQEATFWLSVMNELKNRGLQDVLIAVVPSRQIWPCQIACRAMEGLKGFPDANTAALPEAMVNPGLRPFRAELISRINS